MSKSQINVAIVDDQILFTEGLKSLLIKEKEIIVSETFNSGKHLLSSLNTLQADIILLDIRMPQINGLDLLKEIRQLNSKIKILILSTYNEDYLVEKAKKYGADAFALKTTSVKSLVELIKKVLENEQSPFFEDENDHNQTLKNIDDTFLKQFKITKREKEIIQYIKKGYTSQQIADELSLSVFTITTHRKNIAKKLGLNNVASLLEYVMKYDF